MCVCMCACVCARVCVCVCVCLQAHIPLLAHKSVFLGMLDAFGVSIVLGFSLLAS